MLFIACKSSNEDTSVEKEETTIQLPPAIAPAKLVQIFENCDHIDFIFTNLPFSISQDDKSSIQQTVRQIEPRKPEGIDFSCNYMAEQIFMSEGEIILDAKIFFEGKCTYYLFYEDGKPKYSASMTQAGITFYNNILAQAKATNANG